MNGRINQDRERLWKCRSRCEPRGEIDDLDVVEPLSRCEINADLGGKSFWHKVGKALNNFGKSMAETGQGSELA